MFQYLPRNILLQALLQNTEFTRDMADRLFSLDLVCCDGISNYIHLVDAFHIRSYFKKE
jgi:hypothetical protein